MGATVIMVLHHAAAACEFINFLMALIAITFNYIATGNDAAGNTYGLGVWKWCMNNICNDYTEAGGADVACLWPYSNTVRCVQSRLPGAIQTTDIGMNIDMATLKALYTMGVVLVFLALVCSALTYSDHTKALWASILSFIASIFWLATGSWLTQNFSPSDYSSSLAIAHPGFSVDWDYTYVYIWLGWILCMFNAIPSYLYYKAACAEHAPTSVPSTEV